MATNHKVYQSRYVCKYKECGVVFYSAHKRQFCCSDCKEMHLGEERYDKQETDPTLEEIAFQKEQMRSGKLVIGVPNRPMPNWFIKRRR